MTEKPERTVSVTADEARRSITPEERARLDGMTDADINRGIAEDPDTFELDDEWFAGARRVSPLRPAAE